MSREKRIERYAEALAYALEHPESVSDEMLGEFLQIVRGRIEEAGA